MMNDHKRCCQNEPTRMTLSHKMSDGEPKPTTPVSQSIQNARSDRSGMLLKMPPECAVSLTFANRGENEKGMQIIGGSPSRLVSMKMLREIQIQWEGESELHDLSALVDTELVEEHSGRGAGILVLRRFAQTLIGEDAPAQIEHELELQKKNGKIDTQALMRGQVKNKNARHNNVMAHFDQEPDHPSGKGTVVKIKDYPFINELTSHAGVWMQQDWPLICEQNRYFNVKSCGIGWHGRFTSRNNPYGQSLKLVFLCLQVMPSAKLFLATALARPPRRCRC